MSSFAVSFQTNLCRRDVEEVDAVSLLERELHVRRGDGDWLEVADLARCSLLASAASESAFPFRLFDVSDHPQGRFQVSGRQGRSWQTISDQAASCRGDASGLFLYTAAANFWIDWDQELCAWVDRRSTVVYDELLIVRRRVALGPRARLSALAG